MEFKKSLRRIKKVLLEKERCTYKPTVQIVEECFDEFSTCLCTDSKQHFKELYSTEHDAEKRAKWLFDEQGINLSVYPCPYSSGWHLTKG